LRRLGGSGSSAVRMCWPARICTVRYRRAVRVNFLMDQLGGRLSSPSHVTRIRRALYLARRSAAVAREDSPVSFGAAGNEETEHACPVLRREEFDHVGVEFVATRGRAADLIKSMRHEIPVHHVTGSGLGPVELLKGSKQEVRNGLLEGIVHFNLNELYAELSPSSTAVSVSVSTVHRANDNHTGCSLSSAKRIGDPDAAIVLVVAEVFGQDLRAAHGAGCLDDRGVPV